MNYPIGIKPPQWRVFRNHLTLFGFFMIKMFPSGHEVMVGGHIYYMSGRECITCLREIGEATGMNRGVIRATLKRMQSEGMIEIETTNRFTKITMNYKKLPQIC